MAKKLWRIIKASLYMTKKGFLKAIPWFELHMIMLKRSTKIAGKAIGNLILDHQTLTCLPNNVNTTFIAPIVYEFSCSNTPLFNPKRKHNRRKHNQHDQLTVNNVKRVFDILNSYDQVDPEKSPLTLLGCGESPNVRRLRVTDSPFPENITEEDGVDQVDIAAEEFIKNFYKELKQQKKKAAVEPPSPVVYRKWGQVR